MILTFEGCRVVSWCESRVSAAGGSRVGGGAAGGVGEVGDAELDRVGAAGGDLLHLGEFGAGAGEADLEALGLAVPAVGFGFGDAGDEVVADLFEARPGGGIGSQQRAAQTAFSALSPDENLLLPGSPHGRSVSDAGFSDHWTPPCSWKRDGCGVLGIPPAFVMPRVETPVLWGKVCSWRGTFSTMRARWAVPIGIVAWPIGISSIAPPSQLCGYWADGHALFQHDG